MIRLPENMRRTLERVVTDLKGKKSVYGVGLFGSWSRGEGTQSSDVDLLLLDEDGLKDEYVERIEKNGLLVDLDHVPRKWIRTLIPPELDQKLYEMHILYDRDWSLTNTKLLMTRLYGSPGRVDIRTEAHVVDSDIYLSRATSAFLKEDHQSAHLFATVALESILKVLIEIALTPFSNSHFLNRLEDSASKLGMQDQFNEYLEATGLKGADPFSVQEQLRLFKASWDEISAMVKGKPRELECAHFRTRTSLNYCLNPTFLQGAVGRTSFLIDERKNAEASHYMRTIFLGMIESYLSLQSSTSKTRPDYATLIRSLGNLRDGTSPNHECMVGFLGLSDVEKSTAADTIGKSRAAILRIRKDRKVLIKNRLTRS